MKGSTAIFETEAELGNLLGGLRKHFKPNDMIQVSGNTYQASELIEALETDRARYRVVRDTKALHDAQVSDRDRAHPHVREMIGDVGKSIRNRLGNRSPALLDFGLKPYKETRRKLTGKELAQKVDRARATRARNKKKA